jgi:hypothetical protein
MSSWEEMAATVRQVRSPAKASYMRPEEEEAIQAAPLVALRARAAPLELAAEADNGTAQSQRLGPQTQAAVVVVPIMTMTETLTIRLAQEQAVLW